MPIPGKHNFFAAFKYAFTGVFRFFKTDRNGRIELVCAIIISALAFYFKCNSSEWISILLCIALVIGLEMINSALEKICNLIQPGFDKNIQYIKDVAAGAVLICSIIAAIVAVIIFFPKICTLFSF